jgi:hypothetical protein
MANPFPGMDPYLEGPEWHSVHVCLSDEIGRQLSPRVRPKYAVRAEQRTITVAPDPIEMPGQGLPDVAVFEADPTRTATVGTAVMEQPLVYESLLPIPIEQTTVKIWEVAGKRLVTAIEVLSPTNKRGPGRQEYASKRRELLDSSVHFMEIDFLRVGRRFPVGRELPRVPYFVFLSRANRRGHVEIWPIRFDRPLPTVRVPLLPEDADVPLDLQVALTTVYDIYGYDEHMDYSRPPRGHLSRKSAKWIDERLRAQGRRK